MKKLIIIPLVIVGVLSFTACSGGGTNTGVVVSEEKVWPTEIPSEIPKLEQESILKVSTLATSTVITFEGISQERYVSYVEELKAAGFAINLKEGEFSQSFIKGSERVDLTLLEEGALLFDYSEKATDES